MTTEQVKQLEEMRAKIDKTNKDRLNKERVFERMTTLVQLKTQFASQKAGFENSIKKTNDENSQLEKDVVAIEVQIKREQLIKELNTMKTVKKSEAIINQAMKDQATAVQKEIADHKLTAGNLDQQKSDLSKQIERTIPDSIHKSEREIQLTKAQKAKATKEVQIFKEKLGEVDIQDVQLTGKGTVKLSAQVEPNSKQQIDEQDIVMYSEVLEKLNSRLAETYKTIPAENIPVRSPEMIAELFTPEKSATPFSGGSLTPSPIKAMDTKGFLG